MTQPWRSAPSIQALFRDANQRWPKRRKFGDGTIGDEAHQARKSDHNPDAQGIVHAADITHDPDSGPDCEKLATVLVLRRDTRVKYIIWNYRWILSDDWTWKPYPYVAQYGPHTHHMHVSIKSTPEAENDTTPWLDITPVEWALVLLEVESRRAELRAAEEARKQELALLETLASMHPLQQAAPAANGSQLLSILSGVVSAAAAVAKSQAIGYMVQPEPPEMQLPPSPPGYRRSQKAPFAVVREANRLVDNSVLKSPKNPSGMPVGSYLVRQFDGKYFVLLVEWHKHGKDENLPKNREGLKRPHRGFSTFEKTP